MIGVMERIGESLIARARRKTLSLLEWNQKYLPHYFTLPPCRMHHELDELLSGYHEGRGRRTVIIAPRGHAKSTWGGESFVLYCAAEGLEPYIFLFSDTDRQAASHLSNIRREVENNEKLRKDYPHLRIKADGPWNEHRLKFANGVLIEARGAGCSVRGSREEEHRPTLIVPDDPSGDSHAFSKMDRDKLSDWFKKTCLKMGTVSTNVLVMGTTLHRSCLVCELEKTAGWRVMKYKAIEKWPVNMHLWAEWENILNNHGLTTGERGVKAKEYYAENRKEMDAGAVALWPENENLYDLMYIRATEGHREFEHEKQNNPVDPAASEWPSSYFEWEGLRYSRIPADEKKICVGLAVDPKGPQSKIGDFNALVTGTLCKSGNIYVEARLRRQDVDELCGDIYTLYETFQYDGVMFETNNFQQLLKREVIRKGKERGLLIPAYECVNTINKQVRIRRLTSYFSNRYIRFRDTPGTDLLLEQLRDFPDKNAHDDGPDALEMLIRLLMTLTEPRKI